MRRNQFNSPCVIVDGVMPSAARAAFCGVIVCTVKDRVSEEGAPGCECTRQKVEKSAVAVRLLTRRTQVPGLKAA